MTSAGAQDHVPARRSFEPAVFWLALAAFVAWTIAVTTGWADRTVDTWLPASTVPARSYLGQVLEAFSLATSPIFVTLVTASLALRSYRRRQRQVAVALTVAALGMPLAQILRSVIARPRPEGAFADSLSAAGSSYPSGHVLAVTILVWVLVTVANAQRLSTASRVRVRVLGGALIFFTCLDQWALGAVRLSDMVGGWLFGMVIASAALWISGIERSDLPWRRRRAADRSGKRAAVIYNPTKVLEFDQFRRRVGAAMAEAGWEMPVWLETEQDDPGHQMARDARARGVDLVLVAGGDGTVRAVCEELAGGGVPVAIIPAGTGNLLGRNLGVPLDEDEALDTALNGVPQPVDMIRWSAGGTHATFAVMAGVGLDAQIMRDTDPRLKKVVKGGAYVVAGIRQVGTEPFKARIKVDGRVVHDGSAIMALVGNVGKLQGGVNLLPEAQAADGRLHVLVARARGVRGWVQLVGTLGKDGPGSPMRRVSGTRVEAELDREVPFQIDGDTEGSTRAFSAEVLPEALLVMAPRPAD
ncbi:diacylglycerol kinase family protein [Demequina sp. SYSU T00192]|uniref:Diacylglycerol kinase family protein n=1 Tax=Demequina litoralis TaxID=3051660 RepID=A0ABT8GCJ6_9MICO|nr:diacylglycerol kinase family protein [Demequina sp. SYSU T00192]MDN4476863.1 diacylglycerol kinase family protein [Demequina sp. SYSU T00192]